jgi:aminopeptidase N
MYEPMLQYIAAYLLDSSESGPFRSWVRSNFQLMMAKIGWSPAPNESADTHTLRADLIYILGVIGEDQETVQHATQLAEQYLKSPDSVDASMAGAVLFVAARFGDEALFDQYVAAMRQMHAPEQYYNVESALTQFRGQKLAERVLQMAVSDEVRNQDAAGLIAQVLSVSTNQKIAWEWVKANWPAVEKKITMSSGGEIVNATRSFCSTEMRDDVQSFFAEHKVPSAERAVRQSKEDIDRCVKRLPRLQMQLATWLQGHPEASKTGMQ